MLSECGEAVDKPESIRRSVDALERIYAVVVALAITLAIQSVLFTSEDALDWNRFVRQLPALLGFVVTAVPFYHGMDRHLSRTYIEKDVPHTKSGFLLFDFCVFFLEACILLMFASLVGIGNEAFICLMALLSLDSVWALAAHGIHYDTFRDSPIGWTIINFIAIVVLALIYWTSWFAESVRPWALAIAAFLRAVADYCFCWTFYFPQATN